MHHVFKNFRTCTISFYMLSDSRLMNGRCNYNGVKLSKFLVQSYEGNFELILVMELVNE